MIEQSDWHLNKKVPIGIIIMLLIQSTALVWWAATLTQRVNQLEVTISAHVISPSHNGVETDIAAIKARQDFIIRRQDQTLASLDRIQDRLNGRGASNGQN